MNKYLTAAALLAAGTAFANAASVVLSTKVNEGATKADKAITGFTFSLSSDWLTNSLSGADYSSFSLNSLSIEVASNYDTSTVYYLALRNLGDNKFVDVSSAGTLSDSTATFSFADAPALDIAANYAVYFLTAKTSGTPPSETPSGGLQDGAWAAANVASYANADCGGTSDVSHGFITNGSGATNLTDSGHKPNITISGTAIPEPSAFGLLAGAGALALVASRRRRNKR